MKNPQERKHVTTPIELKKKKKNEVNNPQNEYYSSFTTE